MIVLKVYLNNRLLCRAGAEDLSVLTGIITTVGKLGKRSHGSRAHADNVDLELRVGGLTSRGDNRKDMHVDWAVRKLGVGDEVRVRIVDTQTADPAKTSRSADTKRQQERRMFDWAKKVYFTHRAKFEKRPRRARKRIST